MVSSNALFILFLSVGYFSTGILYATDVSCPSTDLACRPDNIGYDAIKYLHKQLDDDRNGNVDLSESDEFLRQELNYDKDFERHNNFHDHGNDKLVSVADLWLLWSHSDVHNWTVDDVLEWLVHHVELPQYVDAFRNNAVDGKVLPRLAANNNHFISSILGIKNPIHKQKLGLKAMDVVLFGPPKRSHNYVKDLVLVASLVIAIGGCWFAYIQHKYSQSHLKKMMKDLDTLQSAETALMELQEKLDHAQQEKSSVAQQKQHLEARMKDEVDKSKEEAERLKQMRESTEEEISRLRLTEEELAQVRLALHQAEKELESQQEWSAPTELQQWLQLTHEIELKHYNVKKLAAEQQLQVAKEGCEKLRKKRQSFMGTFRVAHGSSIDDLDQQILDARHALEEVKVDLQERLHRWHQIEMLCDFNIVNNPGLNYLMSDLSESYASGVGFPLGPGISTNPVPAAECLAIDVKKAVINSLTTEQRHLLTDLKKATSQEALDLTRQAEQKILPLDYKKGLDAKRAKFKRQATTGQIVFKSPLSTLLEEKSPPKSDISHKSKESLDLKRARFKRQASTGSLLSTSRSQQLMAPLNITETDEFEDLPPAYASAALQYARSLSDEPRDAFTRSRKQAMYAAAMPHSDGLRLHHTGFVKPASAHTKSLHEIRVKSTSSLANRRPGSLTGSTDTVSSEEDKKSSIKSESVKFFSPNDCPGSSEEPNSPQQGNHKEVQLSFKKSTSLQENSFKNSSGYSSSLPKSISESALSLAELRTRSNSDSAKKHLGIFKKSHNNVAIDDGNSSPESTDGGEEKKKRKKSVLRSFLKKSGDKAKTT